MNSKKLPDYILEQFVLGELPQEQIDEIERDVLSNESLRERVELIEKSNRDILKEYAPEIFARKIENKYSELLSGKEKKSRSGSLNIRKILYPSFAVAAALVLIFLFNIYNDTVKPIEDSIEITRVKGLKTQLYIYKKNNSSVELLKDGSRARESDLLQLAYVSPEDTHGIIFSIDGRGAVTLQYPMDPKKSTRIDPGRKKLLSRSYELDDAPDFERFYFLTSKSKIDVNNVLDRARELAVEPARAMKGDDVVDKNLKQYSTLIRKGGE